MDEARLESSAKNSEAAYLKYMLASNILYGQLPKLRDYATIKTDVRYKKLDKEFHDRVIHELEKLADELRKLPYVEPVSRLPESQSEAVEQLGQIESEFAQKYPDLQLSHSMASIDSLASPQHKPISATHNHMDGTTPSSVNSATSLQWLATERNRVDEIDAQAQLVDAQARMIDGAKPANALQGVSVISHGNPRVAVALSPQLASIGENDASSEYVSSSTTTCTPSELYGYIERSRTSSDGRPTVLVLDVRPHQDYVWGHIDHKYTVNVDPLGIQKGCSSTDIESAMALAPDEQQDWFRRRDQFDIVVYMGQSIHSFSDSASKEIVYLESLNSAIYHYEYERPLKHPPLFLIGGFDAWTQEMGNRHCAWSEEARRSMARSTRPKSMSQWTMPATNTNAAKNRNSMAVSAADLSSMLSYHAPTSGLSGNNLAPYHVRYDAAPPIPPIPPVPAVPAVPTAAAGSSEPVSATEAISATTATPPVSGSVFDFFRQNNVRYPQAAVNRQSQQQQILPQQPHLLTQSSEDRHRPTHVSFTQGFNGAVSPTSATTDAPIKAEIVTTSVIEPTKAAISDTSRFSGNFESAAAAADDAVGLGNAGANAENLSELRRRKTIFDNPTYGFTGPAYNAQHIPEAPAVVDGSGGDDPLGPKLATKKRRQPPPIPAMKLPPKPSEYVQEDEQQPQQTSLPPQPQQPRQHSPAPPPSVPLPPKPPAYAPPPPAGPVQVPPQYAQYPQPMMQFPPQLQHQYQQQQQHVQMARMQQQQLQMQYQAQLQMQQQAQAQAQAQAAYGQGRNFYGHPVAAGSDPSLNGRMHAGGNLRNSITYNQAPDPFIEGHSGSRASPSIDGTSYPSTALEKKPRKKSAAAAALDSAAYGATGLKNFGNTCFMNCVIQCLIGTGPFCRYFLQGNWKKDLVRDSKKKSYSEVAVEFARLVDNMWRGQYGSLSPIGFRSAVGNCSAQFKGNDQEDAQEFASFLLDALHESLNRVHPRPPPDRDLTPEEEYQFEQLPDFQQANIQWERYIRRNWSIMTSIFQGQIQSRLTCLSCNSTSTTYYTFTELSVPIPSAGSKPAGATALLRKSTARNGAATPVSIYQCLNAFAETETLDGENKWNCPRCRTKRKATKRLLVSRLPMVLVVHLKRFSTIGHFREKLETNVVFPTQQLQMDPYVINDVRSQSPTRYNLYAVANHYGSLSAGHYTASVFNGLRGQWNYFDDTRVSPIAEDKVATPAAYLLFFVQNQPPQG
ncbi:ubiquitin-specific protease doa4 [Coemansia sp. RSA 1721]|nr:ubiquitin-specific protease doa4 [Coemansia sp. RSA 1721]